MSSDAAVREYVETADCVVMLGTFITDRNTGISTARLDRSRTVLATTESIGVRFHKYENLQVAAYLNSLVAAACGSHRTTSTKSQSRKRDLPCVDPKRLKHPRPHADPNPVKKSELTDPLNMAEVMR